MLLQRWHRHLLSQIPREGEGGGGGGADAGAAAAAAAAATAGAVKVEPGTIASGAAADATAATAAAATAGTDAAAAVAAKTPATTIAASDPARPAVPADWPSDWRQKLAGDDKDMLKQLERFGSPLDLNKSYRELQAKLSSGTAKIQPAPPAKDATPEAVAAWRKEAGLPADAAAFTAALALPNGMVPGEGDKPLLAAFADQAVANGWSTDQYNQAVGFYFEQQANAHNAQLETDDAFKQTSTIALAKEWGDGFKPNLNAMQNLLALAPAGVADKLLGGRLADGTIIGNDPAVLKYLVHLAKELNPAATLLPPGADMGGKGVADRMAEITKLMGDYKSEYWQGPKSVAMQEEFRSLASASEKMRERTA